MKRALAALALALLALLVATLALPGAAMLHFQQRVGRRAFGDAIERAIEGETHVGMWIDHVDHVGPDRVVVRGVHFIDAASRDDVMSFDRVVLDPEWLALLDGRIAARRARVHGVMLRMVEDEEGLVIERAFEGRPDRGRGGPDLRLDLRNIHFDDLASEWRFNGGIPFLVERGSGMLSVRTDARGEVVLRFDRIRARARTRGLPFEVEAQVREAAGRVHAGWDRVASFDLALAIHDEPLRVELDCYDRPGGVVVNTAIAVEGPGVAWLVVRGLNLVTELRGDFRGDVTFPDAIGPGRLRRYTGPHGEAKP
jgi:hypothetical protein